MLALFSAGFSTFALMYCVQPLLPEFTREFGLSAASSSLAVSVTTGCLAAAMIVLGALSEGWGRKPLMVTSLMLAALLTMASAAAPSWPAFLTIRAIEGIAFAGLPAIAMAYVGEEIDRSSVGLAMGLYVSGTALGGMSGRLLTAVLTDAASWRVAVAVIGGIGTVAALVVWIALPPSAHFRRRSLAPGTLVRAYTAHLRDPLLARLFAEGFIFMGVFMATYNYIAFRLLQPPYALSQTAAGSVFILYLLGMASSPWAGSLAGRFGRRRTLVLTLALMAAGVLLTMLAPLAAVVCGIGLLTSGFFGAHSVTSSWIGLHAEQRRAQASSLYLCFYYLGASVTGSLGGLFWERFGWTGVACFLLALLAIALTLARGLEPGAGERQPALELPA